MKSQIEITPQEWDLIEIYLDEKDDRKKALLLKEKLAAIPNVEEKIKEIEKTRDEIEDCIRQSKIKEFHQQVLTQENISDVKKLPFQKYNPKIIWYSIAAVLVVSFGILWIMQNNSTLEKIFAENFKPDIGLPLKMGTATNLEFYEGMVEYKQGNYESAIDQWQVLWKNNANNDTLNYFLGVANLAHGNSKESLQFLQNPQRFNKSFFKEDAAYYAALANIKEGRLEDAKSILKKNPSERNTKLLNVLQAL